MAQYIRVPVEARGASGKGTVFGIDHDGRFIQIDGHGVSSDMPEYYAKSLEDAIRVSIDYDGSADCIAEYGELVLEGFEGEEWLHFEANGFTKEFNAPEESSEGWDAPFLEAYTEWLAGLECEV